MANQLSQTGWAVAIRREDGSDFLAFSGSGEGRSVWSKRNRKHAVAYKRRLIVNGFKARVVPVIYTEPQIILPGK